MRVEEILEKAIKLNVSDVHITVNQKIFLRKEGELIFINEEILTVEGMNEILNFILNEAQQEKLNRQREIDCSYKFKSRRFRVNAYYQREVPALALRLISERVPTFKEILAPKALIDLTNETQGLMLVTGRTGSGKSTTLSTFINEIIQTKSRHILTLEDPIEFEYESKNSFISQRELGKDFVTFPSALRSALREMPDILLIGEIRDTETMSMAMEAASAGIFVLGTLHTSGAAETAMRVESMFPINQRDSVRDQFAEVFKGIFSQQLLPKIGGGRISATEVLLSTPASANLIRQGKYIQLPSVMLSNQLIGMQTMEIAIQRLKNAHLI